MSDTSINTRVEEARLYINKTDLQGLYSHNLISMVLRNLADDVGIKYANQLIEEFDLDHIMGIYKVEDIGCKL